MLSFTKWIYKYYKPFTFMIFFGIPINIVIGILNILLNNIPVGSIIAIIAFTSITIMLYWKHKKYVIENTKMILRYPDCVNADGEFSGQKHAIKEMLNKLGELDE